MRKCVFFDRDGIVNMRLVGDYITNPKGMKLLKGFTDLLKYVQEIGYLTILVTNQQGIGKGLMNDDELNEVHEYMQEEIRKTGARPFDDIYYCGEMDIHNPWRRKPNPGMFEEAIKKWDIDVDKSYMIGDMITDAIVSKKVGLKSILLNTLIKNVDEADYEVDSHYEIMEIIK